MLCEGSLAGAKMARQVRLAKAEVFGSLNSGLLPSECACQPRLALYEEHPFGRSGVTLDVLGATILSCFLG